MDDGALSSLSGLTLEQGVLRDLKMLPSSLTAGAWAIAVNALGMARDVDAGTLPPREIITARAQIRQCMIQLHEWAPGGDTGDKTDSKNERRERRLLQTVPDQA